MCLYKCNNILDITEIMATSTNYDELKHTWIEWHNVFGDDVRRLYRTYVDTSNKAARLNGKKFFLIKKRVNIPREVY